MDKNSKIDNKNMPWKDVPKSIWYFLEGDRKKFMISFFVLLAVFFYDLIPVYIVGKMVDFFTKYTPGESLKTFYFYSAFVAVSYVVVSLIRLKSKNVMSIITHKTRARARIWGFERLTEFSLEWHNKENTGNKLQRIFTGAESIRYWLALLRQDLLKIFANITGVLIFFMFTDARFIILIIIYTVVFLSTEFLFSNRIFALSNQYNELNQKAGGTYVESASNMLSIKALGGEKKIIKNVRDRETFSRDILIMRSNINNRKWRFLQTITGISLGIFLLLTGFSFMSNIISIGIILVFFTYFSKLQGSLSDISDLHADMISGRSDLGKMMPIFKETDFIKTGNEKFPKDWDKIEIKNAVMKYGSGQVGLENFNLTLKKNSKIGIAGSSGSGKSTLAKIILGLYRLESGEFKIGNKNYYSILHNETISNITVVLQETELFNLSLCENITMMRDIDDKLLNKAIEISQLKEVIKKLPYGLDSLIGEKGYMLSGGERQRLGIARAIYKNASIIILDEATSSLDSETESKVMEKLLGEYGKDKTFLIIAHR
ncbi:MAG: ABC transporter ATP-binding protein, partial [bacterium]